MQKKEPNIELYRWNQKTKEFYFLGHKIDYVSNPHEWHKYLNDLVLENRCLKERLKHLLQSKLICFFDEVNQKTKSYKLDINDLDKKYEELSNCYNLAFGEGKLSLKNDKGVEMRLKEIKCNVCDSKIELSKKLVYEVSEYNGFMNTKIYNAIDCQKCGCQKILYPRMKKINLDNKVGENK